jgi:hypothetical protein
VEGESGRQGLDSSSDVQINTFAELADFMCPQYMAMGVPYHEYWHGDYTQLQFYYKAHKLRTEQENFNAWLQGAYIYDALCAVSPVLHAYAKSGTKPHPYLDKPYGARDSVDPEQTRAEFLERWKHNKTRWKLLNKQTKGGEDNGGNDRPATNRDTDKKSASGKRS